MPQDPKSLQEQYAQEADYGRFFNRSGGATATSGSIRNALGSDA